MDRLTTLLTEPDTTVAVVGATDNPSKYGSIIYRDLKKRGYRVFAVNPHRQTVDGDPAYPNLAALPEEPTIIDMVVPPEIGAKVVEEVYELGLDNVWLQPGAESPELIDLLEEREIAHVADACIMVRSRLAGR